MSFFNVKQEKIVDFHINENNLVKVPKKYYEYFKSYNDKNDKQFLEYKNFIELTENKKVFLDIGTHVGVFLLGFNIIKENRISYGFDINTKNLNVFKKILEYNKNNRTLDINFYIAGIGDKREEKKIIILTDDLEKENEGLQAVTEFDNEKLVRDNFLPFYDIDKIFNKIGYHTIDEFNDYLLSQNKLLPDVIKIDVEGYEEKVLDGGYKTFTHIMPFLFIEIHSKFLEFYNSSVENIYNKIIDYNYEFYDYNRKKIESLEEYQSLFEDNPELRIYCLPKLRKGQ